MLELTTPERAVNQGRALSRPSTRKPSTTAGRELGGSIECMGASMSFGRGVEIYGEGEPAEYFYKVLSGAVRTRKVLIDGRRQVGGFYLPGDVFGLEAGENHAFTAEAITACKVLVIKHSAIVARAKLDHAVAFELWLLSSNEVRRLQAHLLLLIKNAPERVAAFLLGLAERASPGDSIELPMSRQDIAEHLGLTVETVSRTISYLQSVGAIELSSVRRIVLQDRSALKRFDP